MAGGIRGGDLTGSPLSALSRCCFHAAGAPLFDRSVEGFYFFLFFCQVRRRCLYCVSKHVKYVCMYGTYSFFWAPFVSAREIDGRRGAC